MTDRQQILHEPAGRDVALYEQYGKPLEREHAGEYVAIGPDGRTLVGSVAAEVLRDAMSTFGSGNFTLRRIGYRMFGQHLIVEP